MSSRANRLWTGCLVAAALGAVALGCGGGGGGDDRPGVADDTDLDAGDDPPLGRCARLDGRTFESVEVQPDCGLGPDGPVPCNWRVIFDDSTAVYTQWQYYHSDIAETGEVRCAGDAVVTVDAGHTASYDVESDRLVWDDIIYAPL